jgi:hypothetical protein
MDGVVGFSTFEESFYDRCGYFYVLHVNILVEICLRCVVVIPALQTDWLFFWHIPYQPWL